MLILKTRLDQRSVFDWANHISQFDSILKIVIIINSNNKFYFFPPPPVVHISHEFEVTNSVADERTAYHLIDWSVSDISSSPKRVEHDWIKIFPQYIPFTYIIFQLKISSIKLTTNPSQSYSTTFRFHLRAVSSTQWHTWFQCLGWSVPSLRYSIITDYGKYHIPIFILFWLHIFFTHNI